MYCKTICEAAVDTARTSEMYSSGVLHLAGDPSRHVLCYFRLLSLGTGGEE